MDAFLRELRHLERFAMTLPDSLRLAWRASLARPLESLLVVLVVAFAVALLTTMTGLLVRQAGQVAEWTRSPSAREVSLTPREQDYQGFYDGQKFYPVIEVGRVGTPPVKVRLADLAPVKQASPAVQAAYVREYTGLPKKQAQGGGLNGYTLFAVSPEYLGALGATIVKGAAFTEQDYAQKRRVLLVTEHFATTTFGGRDPLKQTLAANQGPAYRVVGVFQPPPGDDSLMTSEAPFGAVGVMPFGAQEYQGEVQALVFTALPGQVDAARDQLAAYARSRWKDGVVVRFQLQQRQAFQQRERTYLLGLALLASGGLLVAAINISNLMLSRVLSRQRQIGIAGALGASRAAIFRTFLTEALLLGALGGALGLSGAFGLSKVLNTFLRSPQVGDRQTVLLSWPALASGLGLALLLTLVFALYPALQAARVRPAEVLRA